MRTTITIEDDLFERASAATGISNTSELVKIALDKLVSAESRKRLIALGGSAPDFSVPGRGTAPVERFQGLLSEDQAPYNKKP